jgi:hypothetical protein
MVIDMGGATGLRRPVFLAEQLANQAIHPTMLEATLSGANPVWKQSANKNNSIQLERAHQLQVFAFAEGSHRSLIAINLSREESLPVTFSGKSAPAGSLQISQLTSAHITDTNEEKESVHIAHLTLDNYARQKSYTLPPFSMTVFDWNSTQR